MGFLNNEEIVIDAVLTKRGRQLLAEGSPKFQITKFALSDEGVDYSMYNPNHLSGSLYYGEKIENMPLMEAVVDETMTMRYKLITLPKGSTRMPILRATPSSITITFKQSATITPSTLNAIGGFNNNTLGYTCILSNKDLANSFRATKTAPGQTSIGTAPSWLDDIGLKNSIVAVGMEFEIIGADVLSLNANDRSGTITIIGNETGGIFEIPLTVELDPTYVR